MPRRQPSILLIFPTLVLDVLGFGLLIPVAPKLVQLLLAPGAAESDAAPYVAGLQSTFYAMAFLFAPLLGVLSDRFGRRPVILTSLFGSGLDYFAMALAPTVGFLFFTRAINGLTGASFAVAAAYIADITPPARRAAAFGLMGAAFGLGFTLGPLMGGTLGALDIRLPFFAAGALTLLNWLYCLIFLPESLPADRRSPIRLARCNPAGALRALAKHRAVAVLAAAFFLLHAAQFALHATWVLYTSHRYAWGPIHVGVSLFLVGLGAAAVQGGLARIVIPRLGEPRALLLGTSIAALAYLGYALASHGWMIYAVILFGSLGAIAQPAAQSLVTRTVDPTEQGATQGALTSVQSLAGIGGPLLGGFTFAFFTRDSAPLLLPGATYFLSAALALLGLFIASLAVRGWKPRDIPFPSPAPNPTPNPTTIAAPNPSAS